MKEYSIIGSGQYNWDMINLREYPYGFGKKKNHVDKTLTEEVGGTCANVLCMLAHLGWTALPQVKLTEREEGRKLAESLRSFGCDTRYVSFVPNSTFCGMECNHKKDLLSGEHKLTIRAFGLDGSRYFTVKHLRARDEVPAFLENLSEVPDVYFFDHYEAGPRSIARELKNRGTLIYFECENNREWNKVVKSVEVADIVKFSDENVPDTSFADEYNDKLFIQTQGSKGLQFKLRNGDWIHVNPLQITDVVDWEGCGDTITAVFLYELGKIGFPKVADLTESQVMSALTTATEKAARCTQYYGSKTWLQYE